MMPKTQREAVEKLLLENRTLTSEEARQSYGITRLAKYICDMRRDGWVIESHDIPFKSQFGNKSTYARYVLLSVQNDTEKISTDANRKANG